MFCSENVSNTHNLVFFFYCDNASNLLGLAFAHNLPLQMILIGYRTLLKYYFKYFPFQWRNS